MAKALTRRKSCESGKSLPAGEKPCRRIVLVGTYKGDQLTRWRGWYNYPLGDGEQGTGNGVVGSRVPRDRGRAVLMKPPQLPADFSRINELWLFQGTKDQRTYKAEFVGVKTREELIRDYGYPATSRPHGTHYALFKTEFKYRHKLDNPLDCERVIVRTADFAKRSPKIAKQLKAYLESPDRNDPAIANRLPSIITRLRPDQLRVCEAALQLDLFAWDVASQSPLGKAIGAVRMPCDGRILLSSSEVLRRLKISRRNLTKCVEKGWLVGGKDGEEFEESSLLAFQQTAEYDAMLNGSIDERNSLNDLTGKEWIPATKSYMFQKGLGSSHPHAKIEIQHPAPFSFQDIQSLIEFFTKKGMAVLDPFGGVGSTAKACALLGRKCTSIELSQKYHNLSIERLETEVGRGESGKHTFVNGDSCVELPKLSDNSFDFVVTSPPYWGILHKQDQKVLRNRVANNLDTQYSESSRDLGNVADYAEFLATLCDKVFLQCARVLRKGKYMAVVVSDFRDKGDFISFHSDLIYLLNKRQIQGGGVLALQGIKILIQNHKSLHPYGYPFSYVENIHHQYILIFRKR